MHLPTWLTTLLRCIAAGVCIALAVPPFGWWPLAFLGLALWDRSIAGVGWKRRFRRSWLIGLVWFVPTMLWMVDLTPPGYVIACTLYAAYFGVAAALTPSGRARWIVLPATIVLAELAKWTFPFGGVPLANLALTQAGSCAPAAGCALFDSPLSQSSRLLGPLIVVALVVIGGIALSALWERAYRAAAIALGVVVVVTGIGFVAPRGHDTTPLRIAIVQGGGPQRTRAATSDSSLVFERHVQATEDLVTTPVDLILWPENVLALEGRLEDNDELDVLQDLARAKDATMIVGITEGISEDAFLNASVVIDPDGNLIDRYDKVRAVPFGEFVPFRSLIERVAGSSGIPGRDVIPGTEPAVVDTPVGRMGLVISWEVFFANRAQDAIGNGGEVLLNPTNGSSYWLTQVQTQQVASSRLRAIETGRWELQAAPTGFSALVDPDGELLERTAISEQAVIEATIMKREGNTLATTVGYWPMIVLSLLAIALGWWWQRRRVGTEAIDGGVPRAAPEPFALLCAGFAPTSLHCSSGIIGGGGTMSASTERTSGRRRRAATALLTIALAATSACSSSTGTDTAGAPPTTSSGGTSTPGSPATSPGTSAPGTTMAAPASPEAVAANLVAADLGSGWADYPEGAEVLGDDEEGSGCASASGLVDDLPDEDFADGAIIQYGDRLVFAQTNARVFPTPADAQAFARHLLSDTYIECRRDQLERGLSASDPPLVVVSTGTYSGDGTTPYVGAFTYETQQLVDGVAQPAGASSRHAIYVKGSTVIDLFTQLGYMPDDPADLGEVVGTMFDDGMALVLERVEG